MKKRASITNDEHPQPRKRSSLTNYGGFYIWYASIEDIEVGSASWGLCLSQLSEQDKSKVLSFLFKEDKKRSLLSILLQHTLVRHHLGITEDDYKIERTPENKPYASPHKKRIDSWNYNVSHHGKFVCIASHSSFLVRQNRFSLYILCLYGN
jgi:hypothetical protein